MTFPSLFGLSEWRKRSVHGQAAVLKKRLGTLRDYDSTTFIVQTSSGLQVLEISDNINDESPVSCEDVFNSFTK